MKNECEIKVESYETKFTDNVDKIGVIETNLIKPLLRLINVDQSIY